MKTPLFRPPPARRASHRRGFALVAACALFAACSPWARCRAGEGADGASLDALRGQLQSDDRATARRAAWLLGARGAQASAAVDDLAAALAHPEIEPAWYAAEALRQIGPAARKAAPALVELLRKSGVDPALPPLAARALGSILAGTPDAEAVAALADQLGSNNPALRVESAAALVRIADDRRGWQALRSELHGASRDGAYAAARACSPLGERSAPLADALAETLGHADEDVRRAASDALIRLGPQAVEKVIASLAAGRADRPTAAETLGGIGEALVSESQGDVEGADRRDLAKIQSALIGLLSDDAPDARLAATAALARIGPAVASRLAELLLSEDDHVRSSAVAALERQAGAGLAALQGKASAAAVAQALKPALTHRDASARRIAWRLFSFLAPPRMLAESRSLLSAALRDDDPLVRRYAAAALRRD